LSGGLFRFQPRATASLGMIRTCTLGMIQ